MSAENPKKVLRQQPLTVNWNLYSPIPRKNSCDTQVHSKISFGKCYTSGSESGQSYSQHVPKNVCPCGLKSWVPDPSQEDVQPTWN